MAEAPYHLDVASARYELSDPTTQPMNAVLRKLGWRTTSSVRLYPKALRMSSRRTDDMSIDERVAYIEHHTDSPATARITLAWREFMPDYATHRASLPNDESLSLSAIQEPEIGVTVCVPLYLLKQLKTLVAAADAAKSVAAKKQLALQQQQQQQQ